MSPGFTPGSPPPPMSRIAAARERPSPKRTTSWPSSRDIEATPAASAVIRSSATSIRRTTGAGIGPNQIVLNEWCVASGGHARTGLEDNLRLDRDTLAPSNAALVSLVVELCEKYERPVATPAQARALLGLAA